jgi:hypothetical protein
MLLMFPAERMHVFGKSLLTNRQWSLENKKKMRIEQLLEVNTTG